MMVFFYFILLRIGADHPLNRAIAYYAFDGGFEDLSGNGFHGTSYGGANFGTGLGDRAVFLDGVDDHLRLPNMVSHDFSVSFWVKTTAVAPSGTQWWEGLGIVDAEVCGSPPEGDWGIAMINGGQIIASITTSTTQVNDGNWHSVIMVRDMNLQTMTLYIDGVFEASGPGFGFPFTAAPWIGVGNNPCDVLFDRRWFPGMVDDLAFFDYPLTTLEIETLSLEPLQVFIPDPILKDYLLTLYNTNGDGSLDYTEIQNVTMIDLPSSHVKKIIGVAPMSSLGSFNLSWNEIQDIAPLGQNTQMGTLGHHDIRLDRNYLAQDQCATILTIQARVNQSQSFFLVNPQRDYSVFTAQFPSWPTPSLLLQWVQCLNQGCEMFVLNCP